MGQLDNKVAIVTGAAAGLGEAIARMMAKEGTKVAIADINDVASFITGDVVRVDGGLTIFAG